MYSPMARLSSARQGSGVKPAMQDLQRQVPAASAR